MNEEIRQDLPILIWFFGIILGILHSFFVKFIYKKIPNPYMDEEFHINQTREYCNGNWWIWNPKITTPPGLYIIALPFFCGMERYVNSLLIPICSVFIWKLRKKWIPYESSLKVCNINLIINKIF